MTEAILSISVDVNSAPLSAGRMVVEALAELGCPATWVSADPASSPTIAAARQLNLQHEAALLAPAEWFTAAEGRNQFVPQLLRQKLLAQQQGLTISTIASSVAAPRSALDLLAKHGISAIRMNDNSMTATAHRPGATPGLRNLRFGLWQLQIDNRLPSDGWSNMFAGRRIRRAIDRATVVGGVLHLAIDLDALSRDRSLRRLTQLHRTLTHANQRRDEGTLIVTTIAGTIARQSAPRAGRGAQSILRAA